MFIFPLYLWLGTLALLASGVWFAFTKSKRVRWLLASGWFILGLLAGIGIPRDSDAFFLFGFIVRIIVVPLLVVLVFVFYAFVFQGLGWIAVRAWRSLKSIVRD